MHNGLSHLPSQEITFPPSANATALRLALEGVRRLAAQSIAEAEKMVATVELLLQQMQSAPCKTGTL